MIQMRIKEALFFRALELKKGDLYDIDKIRKKPIEDLN